MSSNWRAVFGVLLVFVFGCISGWLSASALRYREATLMLQRGPDGIAALVENRITHNLDLDEKQKEQVHAFFMENLAQRKELQKQIQPQVQILNHTTARQILSILNPDQADRFRQNIAFYRQRFAGSPFAKNIDSLLAPQAPGATGNNLQSPPTTSSTDVLNDTNLVSPGWTPTPSH